MAEAIKIEIPVSVEDNTGAGLSSITKKLSALEKAAMKVSKIMMFGGESTRGIEKSFEKMERSLGKRHGIEISAEDNATPVLSQIEDTANRVDGLSADINIMADDNASPVMAGVEDAAAGLDGMAAEVGLGVEDNATQGIAGVEDAAARLDGTASQVELGAADNASPVMAGVEDRAERVDSISAQPSIGAEDNATPVIDSVEDRLSGYNGKEYSATLSLNEAGNSTASSIADRGRGAIVGAAGAAGISFGVYDAAQNFMDFEQQMSAVKAISGATEEQFASLTAKAKQMGADTKYSALESAQAFSYMAMAGWDSGQMIDGIAGVMNLAAASGESLASTSDIVTDALTAFGLQASDSNHFADVLAQTSAKANTNVGLMGESFKYVAPIAGTMKYSIEDMALALGTMANSGIKGSMAGTALKSSIANLASPTNAMAVAMERYGISLTDGDGNMKSFKGVMDNLRTSLGRLSETEQTAAASTIFGKEAMAGMLAIINASEADYNSLATAIGNADGAAESMAATMMDNLAGSLELLSGEWDETQNQFGERLAPYIESGARALENSLPGIRDKMNGIFDSLDRKVDTMTSSQEWIDAGLVGKVDIAWNTLIGKPFMSWVGGDGKRLISSGIGSLFSSAAQILPGGQEAGLSSWISAAVLGKGALSVTSGISKFSNAIDGMIPGFGKYALAAGAAAAAIGAIGVAVDNYNQMRIDESLEEHFGKVELSASQVEDFVEQMIDVKFTANVEMALGQFNGADEMRKKAEEALASNDALEWKCSVGMTLSEDEQQAYSDNVQTFIDSKKSELEQQFSAITLSINTVIDEENSSSMISSVESWFAEDQAELGKLSSQLSEAVSNALTDGIVSAPEQEAINALQEKINNILSSWNESKSQTQLDMIKQKYGHLTGQDLAAGAFTDIVSSYQEQRETQMEELNSLSEQFYDGVNSAMNSGRLSMPEAEQWKSDWQRGILSKQGGSLANALSFEENTLRDTYGDEINSNLADSAGSVKKGIENQMNTLFASGEPIDMSAFQSYLSSGVLNQTGNASGALKSLYESMAPDVGAMGDIVDRYRDEFGYVPKNLMDAYNSAIEVGAAAGNESAAMQQYANSLLKNGSDALVSALTDPSNEMYETIRAASPELGNAIDRALSETGKDVEIDDIMARLTGLKIDDSGGQQAVQEALDNFTQSIESSGSQIEVSTEGIQVTLGDVEVDGQSAIEQVAAAVNMTSYELAQANGYASAVEVPMGAKITVPEESITFDTSALQSATQEAASATETAPIENETTANTKVTAGETDTSQVQEGVQQDLEQSVTDVPADGSASITLEQTNNAAEVYSQVSGDLQSAFNTTIPVTANASITVNYSIANPSANISFGGGGTGSTSVTARIAENAEGSIVNGRMLSWVGEDGPEAIIPLGSKRRQRGLDLWMQAGRMMGVGEYAEGGIIGTAYGKVSEDNYVENVSHEISKSDSKDGKIIMNVNLSPKFTVNGDSPNVIQEIKSHLKEIVNDIGAELAEKLLEAYENTPV